MREGELIGNELTARHPESIIASSPRTGFVAREGQAEGNRCYCVTHGLE